MRIQVERLKHHADVPAHCVDIGVAIHHIDAVDANHSAARFLEAIAAAQERTLAGAGGTNDEDELLRFDGKIDPTKHLDRAEPFAQATDVKDRGGHHCHSSIFQAS